MLKYTTIGGGFPALGFGGGTISFYSADEIWDLNGVGVAIGGGINGTVLGLPVSGSLEFFLEAQGMDQRFLELRVPLSQKQHFQ